MDQPNLTTLPCKHRDTDGRCIIITELVQSDYWPDPEDCTLCGLDKNPQAVNNITRSISNNILQESGLSPLQEKERPGTNLAKAISWFVSKPEDCDCATREEIMNAWGYEGCKRNRNVIRHWLRESAHMKGIRVPDKAITLLIKLLIG